MARGREPLHAALSLAGRLVRVLRAIIEIPMLAMSYPWENLALGGSITFEFVSDDHARDGGQSFEQLMEELLRSRLICRS
jgi:hypothetical protein